MPEVLLSIGEGGAIALAAGVADELLSWRSLPIPGAAAEVRSKWTWEKDSRDDEGRGGESGNISSMSAPWKSKSLCLKPRLGGHSGSCAGQLP
jgi:hypothetical protein